VLAKHPGWGHDRYGHLCPRSTVTVGRGHYTVGTRKPNSEVADNTSFGVIKLTLSASGYVWEFIPVAGASFRDSGSAGCH